jgi:hypothetical protein
MDILTPFKKIGCTRKLLVYVAKGITLLLLSCLKILNNVSPNTVYAVVTIKLEISHVIFSRPFFAAKFNNLLYEEFLVSLKLCAFQCFMLF